MLSVVPSPKFHWYWTMPPPIAPSRSVEAVASNVTGRPLFGAGVVTAKLAIGVLLWNSSAPRSLAAPLTRGWPSTSVAESPPETWPLSMTGASGRRWKLRLPALANRRSGAVV